MPKEMAASTTKRTMMMMAMTWLRCVMVGGLESQFFFSCACLDLGVFVRRLVVSSGWERRSVGERGVRLFWIVLFFSSLSLVSFEVGYSRDVL
ncbi:hypothetical protein M440DRAFT_1226868 [Trichoderma longibrachiatum ATCC 18648]|uniref:Uncharacterized protein n=1 Tax=Trichoderma longibrachiatum ATCC 18648 TaxID=983965 RepID=A0A2T4C8M4_TRILO|nr:hypothetical protein M440DRAFT_1226868 [Trichoderma longibrachiatum ATCC 18648]